MEECSLAVYSHVYICLQGRGVLFSCLLTCTHLLIDYNVKESVGHGTLGLLSGGARGE